MLKPRGKIVIGKGINVISFTLILLICLAMRGSLSATETYLLSTT